MEMQSGRRCTEFYDPRSRHVWEGAQHGAFLQKSPVFLSARRSSWVGPCSGQKGDESDEYFYSGSVRRGSKTGFLFLGERRARRRLPWLARISSDFHFASVFKLSPNCKPVRFFAPDMYVLLLLRRGRLPPSLGFLLYSPAPSLPRPHSSLDSSGSVE